MLERTFHKKKKKPGNRWRMDETYLKVNGKLSLVNIDKIGANKAGLGLYNRDNNRRIKNRQCKYINNIIEQDQRGVKRITRSMFGFKSFHAAQSTLAGIELVAMLKKGQMKKSLASS